MAKKVTGMIKLQVQAGKANPAPVSYTHLDVYKRQNECRESAAFLDEKRAKGRR